MSAPNPNDFSPGALADPLFYNYVQVGNWLSYSMGSMAVSMTTDVFRMGNGLIRNMFTPMADDWGELWAWLFLILAGVVMMSLVVGAGVGGLMIGG